MFDPTWVVIVALTYTVVVRVAKLVNKLQKCELLELIAEIATKGEQKSWM